MIRVEATRDVARCLEIRRIVFIDEQAVPEADELDGLDDTAEHFLATADGAPAGAARLRWLDEGRVAKGERMAVLAPFRGRGVGAALLAALEARAREGGARTLAGAAQTHALAFYEGLGFCAEGPEFMDAGIPHRHIHKRL